MGSSDEEEISFQSEAEQIAIDRKKRLMALKSAVHGVEMKEEDYAEPMQQDEPGTLEDPGRLPSFRSYDPEVFIKANKEENRNLNILDEQLQDQLADTNDTSVIKEISVSTLAPRKLDWDLKRDVKDRLDKLERQTQRAINQLIRQRLATGENDLAAAVNSAMVTQLKAGLQEEE